MCDFRLDKYGMIQLNLFIANKNIAISCQLQHPFDLMQHSFILPGMSFCQHHRIIILILN